MSKNKDWTGNQTSIYKTLGASSHSEKDREENDFYANAKNSAYQHSVMLIKGHDGEKIFLQQEDGSDHGTM